MVHQVSGKISEKNLKIIFCENNSANLKEMTRIRIRIHFFQSGSRIRIRIKFNWILSTEYVSCKTPVNVELQ